MEKVVYYAEMEGISLEHMVRNGKFDMRVKHFHNEYEIFYILEGERLFFFNNRNYLASKGDLILVDTNLIHMTKSVTEEDQGHNRIILYIGKGKLQELSEKFPALGLVRFFQDNYGVYHLNKDQQYLFMQMYEHLQTEFSKKHRNYKYAIELEILSYFLKLVRDISHKNQETPQFGSESKYRTAYAVADYLSENCQETISLEDLSSHFYLSKYYICRVFKEVTGYTISEYINIHRIKKAKRYLEETDMSISSIAHALGYESITYFEKMFKTYMTISPLKYRKTLNTVTHTNIPTNP